MTVAKKTIERLRPYLVGSAPGPDGEWDMHCPLHEDNTRSARLNVKEGVWYCHAKCGGGTVEDLLSRSAEWIEPGSNGTAPSSPRSSGTEQLSEEEVERWTADLAADKDTLEFLVDLRGVSAETLLRHKIGYDAGKRCFTIPVYAGGVLVNVRRYQPFPTPGRARGIWNTPGHGSPSRLWPEEALASDTIIVCEGEFDALVAIDRGFVAITKTSGAKTWIPAWSPLFKGKTVYLCHDCDRPGQDANQKIGRSLARHAKEVFVVRLPFEITEDHGKDITDFFFANNAQAFQKLLDEAEPFSRAPSPVVEPKRATIADATDATRVGQSLRIPLTVKGKHSLGYAIAREVRFDCSRDAGAACAACPLVDTGTATRTISPDDPICLSLMDATDASVRKLLRESQGIPTCKKLSILTIEHQSVETLFARPSLDDSTSNEAGDLLQTLKVTSVGHHDTPPNSTIQVVGALYPNPRTQANEFLVWEVAKVRTSVDHFMLTPDLVRSLMRFRPKAGQTPLAKAVEIADEMSAHVTNIYDRRELHVAIDLVFHSALSFEFNGEIERKGWMDILVIGDTRTGKSETAARLARHYQAGEVISCESASIAGILAAVQQFGGKEWTVTWGAIPINDRRLVVLDEVSGLKPEDIASMSSVRSSGLVQVQKVSQDVANARTRLVWIGNPRSGNMDNFTYGVQAIAPLIGNPEDIARFDLAMSLASGDVDLGRINRPPDRGEQRYPSDDCAALVRWAWSRTANQVTFEPDAEQLVLELAQVLGEEFIPDPPLIQGADARKKIARIAVALAARTFSTDETYTRVLVKTSHVEGAVAFIRRIYGAQGFGYAELSLRARESDRTGRENQEKIAKFLKGKGQLKQFLTDNPSFRRPDLEETLNLSKEESNAIIAHLWETRMVRKQLGNLIVQPVLHEILRGKK